MLLVQASYDWQILLPTPFFLIPRGPVGKSSGQGGGPQVEDGAKLEILWTTYID